MANLVVPYEPGLSFPPRVEHFLIQALLYVPLVVLTLLGRWRFAEFGILLGSRVFVASALALVVTLPVLFTVAVDLRAGIVEGFARFGEELFFRGFLFALVLGVSRASLRPWLWAVIVSSAAFTLVHTQTFQPAYFRTDLPTPLWFLIMQRLLNVFLIAVVFALVRRWSGSILPAVIVHTALNGGLTAVATGVVLYAVLLLWAAGRRELATEAIGVPR